MRISILSAFKTAALALLMLSGSPAFAAASITGFFTVANGNPSALGGSVTFTLNPDGTINASLTSTTTPIIGFGFDSDLFPPLESNFAPTTPDGTFGWSDLYGLQVSGFYCASCGLTETWTIGTPGQFTDAFQAVSGSLSQYDFFLLTNDGTQWAANAVQLASVPEPGTWATMLLGFGAMGLAMRRFRARKPVIAH